MGLMFNRAAWRVASFLLISLLCGGCNLLAAASVDGKVTMGNTLPVEFLPEMLLQLLDFI